MYNARFLSDSGKEFRLGYAYGTIFDIDPLSGVTVTLGTEQGYEQVGESVTGKRVAGVTRKISGYIIAADRARVQREMLSAFSPTASGRLYFNDLYYAECEIKKIPEFEIKKNRMKFAVQVYCAYPYWFSATPSVYAMNTYNPAFSFPVNYEDEHVFGVKNPSQFINCFNKGEEPVPLSVMFTTETESRDYRLTHVHTLEHLWIHDTLHIGDKVIVERRGGVLKVEKTAADGQVTDLFSALDEDSTLFDAAAGDNVLVADAQEGADGLIVYVTVADAKVGVYDGIV